MKGSIRAPARTAATALWSGIALAASTGCIPIVTSIVEVNPTTGEQLQAIHAARAEAAAGGTRVDPAALDAVRARLLKDPPAYTAVINTYSQTDEPINCYSFLNPGLYAPLDRERADLKRAHAAGLLSDAEHTELLALLEVQGKRSLVRRWFETCANATAYSVHNQYLSGSVYSTYESANPNAPDRRKAAEDWLRYSLHDKQSERDWRITRGYRWYARIVMTPQPPAGASPDAPPKPAE